MKRQFALPISFAVALHAALLFGFSKPPPRPKLPEPTIRIPFTVTKQPDDEPPVVAESAGAPRPTEVLDRPPPTLPEPLVVDSPTKFALRLPPVRPAGDIDVTQIVPPVTSGIGPAGGGWTTFIPVDQLDKSPHTRFQPAPNYPYEAKMQGVRGEVLVEFFVDEGGHVRDPRVISSSSRIFEEPTLRAVSRWVFEPGRRDGKVVSFRMSVPVMFNLND